MGPCGRREQPLTTKILLIRHGTHDWLNRVLCGRMAGVILNSAGKSQAETLGWKLESEPIEAIYVSPLERTRETATPLSKRLGLELRVEPRLLELEFGDWTGAAFEALHGDPAWTSWNQARSLHRPPGGETIGEVQDRAAAWLDDMAANHPGQTIAAVSHGDVVKALVLRILGAPIDAIHAFDIAPASVTRIETANGRLKLNSLNETFS